MKGSVRKVSFVIVALGLSFGLLWGSIGLAAPGHGFDFNSIFTRGIGFSPWESISAINGPARSQPSAAAAVDKIFLIGGFDGSNDLDTVQAYHPTTNTWVNMATKMMTPASNVCSVAIGDLIYVLGGFQYTGVEPSYGNYLNTVRIYNALTDAWSVWGSMPEAKAGHACVALEGKIYVFGGRAVTGGPGLSSAHVFDPSANPGEYWSTFDSMTYGRHSLASAVVNGKIYAVGGGGSVDYAYVEVYDPDDSEYWHTVTPLNTARYGPAAYGVGDYLVVCGGGVSGYYNSCEVYDTTQGLDGVWVYLEETMITGRRGFAYATLDDDQYAIGGSGSSGRLASAERIEMQEIGWQLFLPMIMR